MSSHFYAGSWSAAGVVIFVVAALIAVLVLLILIDAVRPKSKRPSLVDVLQHLHGNTGRVEASFASKLVATVDPTQPVIDSVVFDNVGLRLPTGSTAARIAGIVERRTFLNVSYSEFLRSDAGRDLVAKFKAAYPRVRIKKMKMLDLVLWLKEPAESRLPCCSGC